MTIHTLLAALLASAGIALAQEAEPGSGEEWNERAARHLLNRAGFGARPAQVERWAREGRDALLDHLFARRVEDEPFFAEPITYGSSKRELRRMGQEAVKRAKAELKARNRRQQQSYLHDWVEGMLDGEDPLRDRMSLFWHGVFTSQATKVKDSYLLIRQSQLLRENALGNYGDLLRGILRDPAMLVYLDNTTNRKGAPNENLARELLELFSLGEGHYREEDVEAVARALTGYGYERGEGFVFDRAEHDRGNKTVLGVTDRHGADSVVDVILAQPACARWIAGRVIEHLEGVAPHPERLDDYADRLRGSDYQLEPFLRRLFADPAFYRPEVVGARVQSPLEYLVGSSRRLGLRPHPGFVLGGAGLLGQQLFEPPSVKGWEGGEAWISTSTFMARGNLMGVLLGVVTGESLDDPRRDEADEEGGVELEDEEITLAEEDEGELAMDVMMEPMAGDEGGDRARRRDALFKLIRTLDDSGYRPRIHLSERLRKRAVAGDRAVVDALCEELLAVEAPLETRRMLTAYLRGERETLGIEHGALVGSGPDAEHVLRRLAHLILSLPEAQLG